jgi:2-polyprenyl-3-methyl-5-hydroxy-6-metoxy-1,4-benzoquinol methylase
MTTLLERWRQFLLGPPPADTVAQAASDDFVIDFPGIVERTFPDEFPVAWRQVQRVLDAIADSDLGALARRSPALLGYDWTAYLTCSVARTVRVLRALRTLPTGSRVLDYGAYFGNFALACAAAGYRVDAIDSYDEYLGALTPCVAAMIADGIRVMNFGERHAVDAVPASYDAVLCMGVIEHVPHTPKGMLHAVNGLLRPGGLLVLDTPNLGYLYKRLALLDGQTIFCPIPLQFHTEVPFEGHHREFTIDEVRWMLDQAGDDLLQLETFNYSMFAQTVMTGDDAAYQRAMADREDLREVIFAMARRRSG